MFGLYLSEIEKQMRGDSSTVRQCLYNLMFGSYSIRILLNEIPTILTPHMFVILDAALAVKMERSTKNVS